MGKLTVSRLDQGPKEGCPRESYLYLMMTFEVANAIIGMGIEEQLDRARERMPSILVG
jgi:hypothetical protein